MHVRLLVAAAIAIALASCANNHRGVSVYEVKLNAAVGKPFAETDFSKHLPASVSRLPDADGKHVYQYRWKSGCVFVVLVDKKTGLIVSWKFVENEAACRAVEPYTFGT